MPPKPSSALTDPVNATALERAVRETTEIVPNERLIVHTVNPETEEAGPSRFSVPWKSTNLSQMMARFREAMPDGDDLERNIYIGVPDIEGDTLMLLCMYLEALCETPEFFNTGIGGPSSPATLGAAGEPSAVAAAAANGDDDQPASIRPGPRNAAAAAAAAAIAAASTSPLMVDGKIGASCLEKPYKPAQMELDIGSTIRDEKCLTPVERFLAETLHRMPVTDRVRALRGLLCAGWFLQMNSAFLDLVGWLLSLHFRGKNVHQIKELCSLKNVQPKRL